MKKFILFPFIISSLIIGQSYVLNFDGSNDYLSVAASDNASTKLDGQFTLSAWVFIEGADKQQIFYNGGGELEWLGTSYNYFRIQPGAVNSVTNLHRYQWHHVVMTRNISNSIQIYVNGDLSQNYVSSSDTIDDILYIGRDPNQGEYFDGSMDELAIWSTELSAAQITTLYNKGVPESATSISEAASSLQSYWKLEQSTGSTAANSVTNGAALTLNNGPTWKKFKQSAVAENMYNISTGSSSSSPQGFIEYNSKIYFRANDGSNGNEMWEYDPAADASSTNPKRISDIKSGSGDGIPYLNSWSKEGWAVYKNKLYFVGNDGSYGDEVFSYDGSSFTRISDIYSGSNSSSPKHFTVYNDKLYFFGYNSDYGNELYVYDGSSVSLVKDLASGSTGGINNYAGMVVYKDKLYFQGYASSTGYELYSYDGTDFALVEDIYSGTSGSNPQYFTVSDDKLFFTAYNNTVGTEIFYYDGSDVTGVDIVSGTGSINPLFLTAFNDTIYFEGYNSTYDWELWGYDVSKGARLIKDIYPGSSGGGHPHLLKAFDNKLYFQANAGSAGTELWYYDGNDAGRAADVYAGSGSSYPDHFYATTKKLYFGASTSSGGNEPYFVTSGDPLPSIASFTSTTSDGSYKTGDAINITVNFSEAVSLSSGGSITLTLETGSTDRTVSITSISNATSASATYTVQAGDVSSDLTVKMIMVSGSITDASGQRMVSPKWGANLASSSAIVIDGVTPTVASVKSTSTNTTYGTGASINITVNFSESVTLSSGGSMTVYLNSATDRTVSITSISSASSASGTYTVVEGDASGDLSVDSIRVSSGTSLNDAAGNAMSSFSVPADSNLSDFNAIIINTTKPSTPLGFAVSSNYGSVGLAWTAVSSATGYKVYRSTSATSDFASVATPSTNSYSESPSTVTRYYYYVMSVNNLGDSSPSDTLYGYPSEIWYVSMSGNDDNNNGKSADSAFASIEKAVKNNSSLASGDTIYVGPSISSGKTKDDRGFYDFSNIRGGITPPSDKDFVLIGTSGADSTIFNAKKSNRHFYFDNRGGADTKIVGITFYRGKRSDGYGGGSISIRGSNAKMQFINCVFDSNRVDANYPGGAIEIRDQAAPSFTGCTFKNNWVEKAESGASGGAIYISHPNSKDDLVNTINFKQCKFIGNYAKGKYSTHGGAVFASRNTLFENCLFVKNGAIGGLGQPSGTWENARGGAIYSAGGWSDTGIITAVANCTFDSNYVEVLTSSGSPAAADIFYGYGSNNAYQMKAYVFNTVVTGSYNVLGGAPAYTNDKQFKIFYSDDTDNRIYVDYSAIEGSSGQSWINDNVFDINPVYKNAADLDYSLSSLSPVIGQGTGSYKNYNAPTTDLLGVVRPNPSGSTLDMGAYESSLSSSTAPLPVTGIVGTAKTNSAYLSWSAIKSSLGGSENAENIKYLIYQGGSQVGTSTSTTSTVMNLTNGTTYTFSVAAQDTMTSLIGAPSTVVTIEPVYSGPYWYVAASGGKASGYDDDNLGSKDLPLDELASAIQEAATGDTIVMLNGTHSGSGNRNIDGFSNKSLVIMGDPEYGAESTIINASGVSRHFVFNDGEDSTNQVIGLTLYNGKSTDQPGGSVYIWNSNVVFKKVIFKQNKDESNNWSGGGAVFVDNSSEPRFYQCVFDGNVLDRTGTDSQGNDLNQDANGGAVGINHASRQSSSFILFDGCTFKNNVAKGNQRTTGGALYVYNSQAKIYNSLFYNNTAYSSVDGTNNSGAYGSAINISGPSYYDGNEWVGGDVQIINSTIVNNKVKSGASSGQSSDTQALAVILDSWQRQEKVWFFNNIVWGNQSENGNTDQQIEFWGESGWSSKNLNYNVVQNSADIKDFQYDDSFETDPTFSDSTNGDYSLANSSSLIGKGGSSFKNVNAPTTDLLGVVRPNPSGSPPDIGAYENSLSTTPYPAAVTNLTAVGGSGSVTLTWNTVADADSAYKVYQHTSAYTVAAAYYVGATSAKTTPHDTSYTITGLDNTTRYYFRVSAVNKEGYEGTSSALDITPTYSGPVWWVSTTGNDDTGDGGTGKPFKTLKHAIEHVTPGDTVMLKKGTYTGDGNRAIEITANNSDNSAIDFANLKNVVITSEEGAANTIIHANDRDRHFTISGNSSNTIDSTFQFIGLTFEGGKRSDHAGSFYIYANRNYDNNINMDRASLMQPKFKDCVFKDNQAIDNNYGSYGGAFWIENAAPIFESCVFDSNYANRGGGAINIGGGGNVYKDTTWIRNTTFKNNWADDVGTSNNVSVSGGAIWLDHGMNIIIDKSTFQNNSVIQKNADHGLNGGAIAISNSWDAKNKPRVYITNSRFTKNEVRHENGGNAFGGAIYAGAPFTMKNTLIDSNKSGVTSGQGGNRGHGGGLYIDLNAYWDQNGNQVKGYTYLINNTIADNYASGNQAGEAGGIFINHGNETFGTWFNNIIWGNRTDHPEAQRQNLSMHDENTFGIFADYNDVEYSTHYPFFMGSNSYDIDPAFYSATNYQLGTGSPLIGAGVSSYDGIAVPAKDILGNARPNPTGSQPDLGAYENALAESPYPKQVKNLVGTFGSSQVSLSWDANAETDIDKYIIYASTVKDYTPARTDSVGETTTTAYTVTGLTNNTEYHLRVAAVNKTGYEGSYSAQVSVIPKYDGPIWWVSAEAQTNSDGSKEFPFDNIMSAIEQINVGDTIYLEPGVHQSPGSRGINANSDAYPEFYVHGSTGDPKDVVLDAQYASRHFELSSGNNGMIAGFKNITFTKGRASSEDNNNNSSGGGAFTIYSNVKVTFDNCIFYRNVKEGTGSWGGAGGAIFLERVTEASFTHCIFRENRVENGARGGAVFIYDDQADGSSGIPLFDHCKFISNGVEKGQADNQEHLSGGALTAHASVIIQNSLIDSNYVNHNYGGQGEIVGAYGGAVAFSYGGNSQELSSWNNIPYSIFSSNIVSNTRVRVTGYVNGGSISASTKIKMENNLIINNSVLSDMNQNGWDSNGGVNLTGYEAPYAPQVFINNTVAYNRMETSSVSSVRTPGLLVGHNNDTGQDLPVIGNNIIYYNAGDGNNDCCEDFSVWGPGQTNAHINNNLFGEASHDGTDPVSGRPNFKNPSNGNYQLSMSSAAIDAGALSFTGGYNAPIKDLRGYYRVGTPDLGAYEAGASKYILTMADDIAEGDRDFSGDTTFVKFSQKLKFTVTTGDIDGNVVSSNEPVTWNVFPNQKYARVAAGADENSEGGTASATIDVTDLTKGKGFRFRVIADIGDAFLRSNIYVIEELVTGAPPPVTSLTIDPSDWTNNPNFTLSWETPTWAAQRELIGAVVEVTDGINKYNQYLDFQGDTLTNFAFVAPEAGQFDASLRLIDELGNEDPDSSKSVTAYFDDIMPEEFYLHWPNDYVDENGDPQQTYTSDVPSFNWQARDDYPSGVKEWRLFLNDNFNYAYTGSDVNTEEGNRWVNHATTPLNDGYYNWYVEAVDRAGNVTHSSDTAHFGVDLSPPNITHSNPLTMVDENTTSPAINVTFSDAASGVQSGWLNYRRSGTGGGFVVVDLLSGPVNIPGSDIKAEGLEYFIETVDNVGNHGYWPSDTTFHSVRVRSEDPITTAQRWSSGIPGGTDSTNYLFFSIPFEVSNAKSAITTVMGPPDEFNYRLYAYNNGWQENPSSVTMGNAYFFIYDPDKYPDNPNLSFDFGVGVSTPTDPPYSVNVSSGQWKFFGSPYNFNVSLDNVYTEDGTNVRDAGSIYTWGGSWSSVSTLQPWRGYIYKSGGATKLNIDGRGGSFGKMAKVLVDPDNVAMDAAEWTVNIIATTGNARDELNAVGVRHMAKDGYDRLDEFEPPAVPGDVVLRIDNRDREESPDLYAIDIRKPNEQGHYWDLQVFTPTNGNRTYITFDGLGYIPQEYDVFLINKTTQQAKNLEWESSYHFANTGSDRYLRQNLRLVIGTKDFVNENNAGVNLYPDAFTLSQNYPNPFNPQTSIMISLEEDAQVDLVIYNLLGEQITRLAINENRPAGYYTFIWNGTNDVGRKVSTGVYFYHAMIKNSQGRVVLNKTKKMIFLK